MIMFWCLVRRPLVPVKLTFSTIIHNVQLIHDAVLSADIRTGCTLAPWSREMAGLTANELTGLNNNSRAMWTNLDKQKQQFHCNNMLASHCSLMVCWSQTLLSC